MRVLNYCSAGLCSAPQVFCELLYYVQTQQPTVPAACISQFDADDVLCDDNAFVLFPGLTQQKRTSWLAHRCNKPHEKAQFCLVVKFGATFRRLCLKSRSTAACLTCPKTKAQVQKHDGPRLLIRNIFLHIDAANSLVNRSERITTDFRARNLCGHDGEERASQGCILPSYSCHGQR